MRYIHTLQSHITPLINFYIETLEEAFADINTFLDNKLESDSVSNAVIAGIALTPVIGSLIFIAALMFSA